MLRVGTGLKSNLSTQKVSNARLQMISYTDAGPTSTYSKPYYINPEQEVLINKQHLLNITALKMVRTQIIHMPKVPSERRVVQLDKYIASMASAVSLRRPRVLFI